MRRSKKAIKELEASDKWVMAIYLLISVIVWYLYNNVINSRERGAIIFFYGYGTQFFLYMLQYKAIRKPLVYIFWFMMGLAHLAAYLLLKQTDSFIPEIILLRNTIILLVLIQLLRWISLRVQGMDLVGAQRGGRDIFNERRITPFDILLTFIYLGTVLGLFFAP